MTSMGPEEDWVRATVTEWKNKNSESEGTPGGHLGATGERRVPRSQGSRCLEGRSSVLTCLIPNHAYPGTQAQAVAQVGHKRFPGSRLARRRQLTRPGLGD